MTTDPVLFVTLCVFWAFLALYVYFLLKHYGVTLRLGLEWGFAREGTGFRVTVGWIASKKTLDDLRTVSR